MGVFLGERCSELYRGGGHSRPRSSPAGKWWFRREVYVRYRSPADGQQHSGAVTPIGGQSAVDSLKLRAGEHRKILAHDERAIFEASALRRSNRPQSNDS